MNGWNCCALLSETLELTHLRFEVCGRPRKSRGTRFFLFPSVFLLRKRDCWKRCCFFGQTLDVPILDPFFPKQLTVGVLNATLDLAALVLVGVVGFLGSEVVLSPVVSHCLRLSPFMWGVGVGWCGRLLGL